MNASATTFGSLVLGLGSGPWTLVFASIVSALFGMLLHWGKVVFKDKLDVSLLEYFFVLKIKNTLYAVLGVLGGLFAAFSPIDYTTISLYQVIMQAFAIGYASDSMFNTSLGDSVPDEVKK